MKKRLFMQTAAALALIGSASLAQAQATTPIKFQLDWRFEGPAALFLVLLALQQRYEGVIPRSVGILQPLVFLLLVGASRTLARGLLRGLLDNPHEVRRRLLVYGAGDAGVQTVAAMGTLGEFEVVGFVDDDPTKRGMRVIGVTYYGKRHVTSGSKPIKTVDDMKGFKLRVPEVDTFKAMAEAWGARATPINFNELYLALSQGAVDGQENPLPTIQSGKLNEVQKHLVLTGHIITPRLVIVNDAAWQKIPAADRDLVKASIDKASKWQDDEIIKQENSLADTFKAGGMTVTEPDLESFRKPVLASVPKMFEAKWGKGFWDRLQAI